MSDVCEEEEVVTHQLQETPGEEDNVTPRNLYRTGLASTSRTVSPTDNQGKESVT